VGANLDHHPPTGVVGGGPDLGDDEVAVVLAFGVLVEFGILDDELADGSRQTADVEVAVATVDGLDGQLAWNIDHG